MTSMSAAQLIAAMRQAAAPSMTEGAELVRDLTRARTPDDPATGGDDLRESLTVEPATPNRLEAGVYSESEYAAYQHEALDLQHPHGGEAKFLERTSLESVAEYERVVAAGIERRLG